MGGGGDDDDEKANKQAQDNIEIWKIKKLIRSLEAARGCVHALSLAITQRRAALPFAGNTSRGALHTCLCLSLAWHTPSPASHRLPPHTPDFSASVLLTFRVLAALSLSLSLSVHIRSPFAAMARA